MEKKRLDYLDMAKGIGIVLVLLGHLQGDSIFELSPYIHPFCVFIFSFHMPLFFIVSGILMAVKKTEEKSLKSIAISRFKGIMIPYYWFSLFYMSVVIAALIKGGIQVQTLFVNLWYVLSGYGMNVLWFLPALYLGELLFVYLRQKFPQAKSFIAVVTVGFLVAFTIGYLLTIPNNDTEVYKRVREFVTVLIRPLLITGFMTIGYYGHKLCETNKRMSDLFLQEEVSTKLRIGYIVMGILLMCICLIFSKVNNGIDVRSMVLRNIFFFMLCALSGSYGLIIFCKGLPRLRLLCYWGTGSLIFMATHNSETVLYYAMKLAMYVNQYLTRARGYICYAIIAGTIIVYSTMMIAIIKRLFPFIIGKSYKRSN